MVKGPRVKLSRLLLSIITRSPASAIASAISESDGKLERVEIAITRWYELRIACPWVNYYFHIIRELAILLTKSKSG